MAIQIDASPGAYAELVLLPGDPVRAKSMAEGCSRTWSRWAV